MKKMSIFFLSVVWIVSVRAQDRYVKQWDSFLNNKHENVIRYFEKKKLKNLDIEALLLYQLARSQDGKFSRLEAFYPNFVKHPDYPYYLFALWNERFFFDDYVEEVFHKDMLENVNFFYNQNISHPEEIAGEIKYLKSVMDMYVRDFEHSKNIRKSFTHIDRWQFCGVFENLNESGMRIAYPPETSAFSKEGYNANSNGIVNWFDNTNDGEFPYFAFYNHEEYGSGINYAQTFVQNPRKQTVLLKLSLPKDFKLWVNDVLVFEKDKYHKSTLDAYTVRIDLPAGNNRFLIKTTNGQEAFFALKIVDTENRPVEGLTYSTTYAPYNRSTEEELNPVELENVFESFFKNKLKENPSSVFYKIMLFKTYLRNEKDEEAEKIIKELLKTYPQSTFLRENLMVVYQLQEKTEKINELKENIINDDPDGFTAMSYIFYESNRRLKNKDINEIEAFAEKFKKKTDLKLLSEMPDIILLAKKNDMTGLKAKVNEVIELSYRKAYLKLIPLYSFFRRMLTNDSDRELEFLNRVNEKYYYPKIIDEMIKIYEKKNEHDKALALLEESSARFPGIASLHYDVAKKLKKMEKYDRAEQYVDKVLAMFPYSFVAMKLKGDILRYAGKEKEAVKWYGKSLKHNAADMSLRKTLDAISGKKDPVKKYVLDEAYTFIKKNRNKKRDKNYDINILHTEKNYYLYDEGALRYRFVYIYEITSENGVDNMKEIDLGLYGNYTINKYEIVKPSGNVVPADKSGSNLVFQTLQPGDVIYIDYEWTEANTGRFYKDFTESESFNDFYPIDRKITRFFIPENRQIHYKVINGQIPGTTRKEKDYIIYEWHDQNVPANPPYEKFMPEYVDVERMLSVSTLKDWDEIARWYSDLSSSSIRYDNTVNKTFREIFPEGYEKLSEEQRAKKIYHYITDHINYSYVDFRQSGKIPQKASKTIETRLGDCKDMSTLFVTLARKAGLKANIVLVKTNDFGRNSLILPSTAFNHAIARVLLDGKVQYLELTDKYLPFKALPRSLIGATVLDIPFDRNDKNVTSGLHHLDKVSRTPNILTLDYVYDIYDDKKIISVKVTGQGALNSYFHSMLEDQNEENRKKSVIEYFENLDELDLKLIDYKIIRQDRTEEKVIFEAKFEIADEMQTLSDIKIFKLPLQPETYTPALISLDERKYPLRFIYYEYADAYKMNYTINLKGKNTAFFIIPKNASLEFEDHRFDIRYNKTGDKTLQVNIDIRTALEDDIRPEAYGQFKQYVSKVIKALDEFIGFK